jgi:hypothetical protein
VSPEDAAAIASVCACVVGVVNVIGQVVLNRHVEKVHKTVNGMSTRRARRARAEGVASQKLADTRTTTTTTVSKIAPGAP